VQRASQIISHFGWAGSPARSPCAGAAEEIGTADERRQDLGYIARVFAQMGLPHSNPGDHVKTFERRSGIYRLKLTADEESHLPTDRFRACCSHLWELKPSAPDPRKSSWERT
jgi:hypothetical protein